MGNPYQTNEFKKLFQEWNKKLKKSGFKDAEDFRNLDQIYLKTYAVDDANEVDPVVREALEEYHRLARGLNHTYKFKSKTDKNIWALHAEGISIRKIKTLIRPKVTNYRIWKTIKTISQEIK